MLVCVVGWIKEKSGQANALCHPPAPYTLYLHAIPNIQSSAMQLMAAAAAVARRPGLEQERLGLSLRGAYCVTHFLSALNIQIADGWHVRKSQ